MKSFVSIFALLLTSFAYSAEVAPAPSIEAHFSPKGGCTAAVLKEIAAAKQNIFVQAHTFNSASIAKALLDAHKRGVKIQVILDKSQRTARFGMAETLVQGGILTFLDDKHPVAHNKVMVIDAAVVLTGSFDFDKAAEESNAENLVVIRDPAIAEKYLNNWTAHMGHSAVFEKSASADALPKPKHPRQ